MILWLFLVFQVKHLIVDFFLQSEYQYKNKGTYGHAGGIIHSALHAAVTMFILFWLIGPYSIPVMLAEFFVHYHIDWLKVKLTKNKGWAKGFDDRLEIYSNDYFLALGVDQFLHQLTYIAIIAAIL